MRAVNHHDLREVLLLQRLADRLDAVLVEVGALGSTTEDNEAVLVSSRPGDGSQTLLCYTHEVVLCGSRTNSVDGHCQPSIGSVLESNGEGETRGKLTVQLGLCCARTDSAKRDEVREELWGDGVEHLRGNGHAGRCEVDEQLARDAETLVDLVALVNVGVVDETLPANSCPWLLEVGTHDDAEVVLKLVGNGLQSLAVLNGQLGVVEGAGSDHDQETVILLCDDLGGVLATLNDGLLGVGWDGDLGGKKRGGDQRVVTQDWRVGLA